MKGKASLLMSKPIFIRKEKGLGLNPSRWKHEGQDDEFEGWVGHWSDLRGCRGALSKSQRSGGGERGGGGGVGCGEVLVRYQTPNEVRLGKLACGFDIWPFN